MYPLLAYYVMDLIQILNFYTLSDNNVRNFKALLSLSQRHVLSEHFMFSHQQWQQRPKRKSKSKLDSVII